MLEVPFVPANIDCMFDICEGLFEFDVREAPFELDSVIVHFSFDELELGKTDFLEFFLTKVIQVEFAVSVDFAGLQTALEIAQDIALEDDHDADEECDEADAEPPHGRRGVGVSESEGDQDDYQFYVAAVNDGVDRAVRKRSPELEPLI